MSASNRSSDDGYEALRRSVAWIDRGDRLRLDVSGPDRAKFLHNLTTNDVKRLAVGSGREAFVTTPQGKTLAFISYLATDRNLIVRTEGPNTSALFTHLRKYSVFDNVEIEDASTRMLEYHVAGPRAEDLLRSFWGILPQPLPLNHVTTTIQGMQARIVRESPTGQTGFTILAPRELEGPIQELLGRLGPAAGLSPLTPQAFQAACIEAGTPTSGVDVRAGNLPQEVGRDRQAIDFAKGCYLGQETVARLDALGHVNKKLAGLLIPGESPPEAGVSLWSDGKAVGELTSATYSPGWGKCVGMGYVRAPLAVPGSELTLGESAEGGVPVVVAAFPMVPPG